MDTDTGKVGKLAFEATTGIGKLFDQLLKEIGCNGGAVRKFPAWLERKQRSVPDV
jgi:hypothetical protein